MHNFLSLPIALLMGMIARSTEARPFDFYEATSQERGYAWEQSGEFEGDILLQSEDSARNGLITRERHWPNKTLIYEIDDTYEDDHVQAIQEAIDELNSKTCVKLRPKQKGDESYVFITGNEADGCSSFVGRHGGKQVLKLKPKRPGKGCFRRGTILHELLHALGFYHQQSAPERDDYVKILWKNIKPGRENNFQKYGNDTVTNYGVKYDYNSVMHYSAYAFSKNDEKTIEPLEEDADIGQREDMSQKDIEKLRNMYKCNEKPSEIQIEEEDKNENREFQELETFLLS